MTHSFHRVAICLSLLLYATTGWSQLATQQATKSHRLYLGIEAGLFFNRATQLVPSITSLQPNQEVAPTATLVLGYQLTPQIAVELRPQDVPITSGYDYASTTASGDYIGFGQRYTHDYVYVPVLGVWQVLGGQRRVRLAVTGGGGVAFTDTSPSLINPNGTTAYYTDGQGSIGSGPTAPPGTTITATTTQQLTREQGAFGLVEAGLRGSWWVRPRLALDLSVRHLWGLTDSIREIDLTIQTPSGSTTTTQRTPVRGICTGLTVRYSL